MNIWLHKWSPPPSPMVLLTTTQWFCWKSNTFLQMVITKHLPLSPAVNHEWSPFLQCYSLVSWMNIFRPLKSSSGISWEWIRSYPENQILHVVGISVQQFESSSLFQPCCFIVDRPWGVGGCPLVPKDGSSRHDHKATCRGTVCTTTPCHW